MELIKDHNEAFADLMDQVTNGKMIQSIYFPDPLNKTKFATLNEAEIAQLNFHHLNELLAAEAGSMRYADVTTQLFDCFSRLVQMTARMPDMLVTQEYAKRDRLGISIDSDMAYGLVRDGLYEHQPVVALAPLAMSACSALKTMRTVIDLLPPHRIIDLSASVMAVFWAADKVESRFSVELSLDPHAGETLQDVENDIGSFLIDRVNTYHYIERNKVAA